MFALGTGDGKTVPTKTSPSSLQRLWRTLSAEKKRRPLRFLTCPVKSTRAHFKEIQLWERCKTTVIYGMKWMMNSANVGNAGSINHPPGCLCIYIWLYMYVYSYMYIYPLVNQHSHGTKKWIGTSSINGSFCIAMLNNQRVLPWLTGWITINQLFWGSVWVFRKTILANNQPLTNH